MDISENGQQIGEKLSLLLDAEQWQELIQYILNEKLTVDCSAKFPYTSSNDPLHEDNPSLTEFKEGEFYFCLETRKVCIGDIEIELTVKEFDALHLLILNRKRVLTFETIAYHVWGEDYIDITAKTIHNLMSRLRQKLQVTSDTCEYIFSIRGIGYKFDSENGKIK